MIDAKNEKLTSSEIEYGNLPGSVECVFPDANKSVLPVFDYSYEGVMISYANSMVVFNTSISIEFHIILYIYYRRG
jgi:hypothetical protein